MFATSCKFCIRILPTPTKKQPTAYTGIKTNAYRTTMQNRATIDIYHFLYERRICNILRYNFTIAPTYSGNKYFQLHAKVDTVSCKTLHIFTIYYKPNFLHNNTYVHFFHSSCSIKVITKS